MWRLVAFLCALFGSAHSQTTAVSQCTSNPGSLPINSYISGCTTPPCILPQLEDCVIDVVFRAPHNIRSMRTLATAYMSVGIITLPVPYDLQENAVTCNFLTNTYCPLLRDEVVRYTLRMYIEPFFPAGTSTTIEFRVVDQDSNTSILCLRTAVRIVPPRDTSRNNVLVIDAVEEEKI